MTELIKFGGQIGAALAICWIVIKLVLDRYLKVSEQLELEKKQQVTDNIKRIESSNLNVQTSVSNLKNSITELQTRVLKSQIKNETFDEKLKEISQKLEKLSDETRASIKEVEKSILVQLGNDLIMIKTLAQKLQK